MNATMNVTLASVCWFLSGTAAYCAPPIKVIYDTDMMGDCDDVGALALLHQLTDNGEAELLAVIMNGCDEDETQAASAMAVNAFYGRKEMPIGIGKTAPRHRGTGQYGRIMRQEFIPDCPTDAEFPDAVDVYRRVLASQLDASVKIVTVGFLNTLRDLLRSKSDRHSQLEGVELVRKKVVEVVSMAGDFPDGRGYYNIDRDIPSAVYALEQCPVPLVYAVADIGFEVITGPALQSTPKNNPVRRIFEVWGSSKDQRGVLYRGRPSWDQTAVLYAVRGIRDYWDISRPGVITITTEEDERSGRTISRTHHKADPAGLHRFLIKKKPDKEMSAIIDRMMAVPPKLAP